MWQPFGLDGRLARALARILGRAILLRADPVIVLLQRAAEVATGDDRRHEWGDPKRVATMLATAASVLAQ